MCGSRGGVSGRIRLCERLSTPEGEAERLITRCWITGSKATANIQSNFPLLPELG